MGCNYALYFLSASGSSASMYKCNKEDPNNARNEETENRGVEMPMRSPKKVMVAGKSIAPVMVPESWYVDE